jgi:hypothetical protein
MSSDGCKDASLRDELALHIAALDSLETILFGNCYRRSRDEVETRADAMVRALRYMADYQLTGTEQTLHIDFQGKAREALDVA